MQTTTWHQENTFLWNLCNCQQVKVSGIAQHSKGFMFCAYILLFVLYVTIFGSNTVLHKNKTTNALLLQIQKTKCDACFGNL